MTTDSEEIGTRMQLSRTQPDLAASQPISGRRSPDSPCRNESSSNSSPKLRQKHSMESMESMLAAARSSSCCKGYDVQH